MPDMGIKIDVDVSQVKSAYKELSKLAEMKKSMQLDMEMPPHIADSIRKVGGFGGIDPKHLQSMDAGTRRIQNTLDGWVRNATRLKAEIRQITADLKGLEKASLDTSLKPKHRGMMLDEMQQLTARRAELEKASKAAESKAQQYRDRLPDHLPPAVTGRRGTGANGDSTGGNNSNSQWMRRALGFATTLAGVGTVAGFIGGAKSTYRNTIDIESPLFARGIRGSRGRAGLAAGLGIVPGEYFGLEDALSRTGLNEKTGLAKSAMLSSLFSKANGVDISTVAGFRSDIYGATGNAGTLPDRLLTQIGRGLDKSRMFELMQRVSQNTHVTAAAMHGVGMSNSQTAGAAALAEMALKTGGSIGTFAKSQDFAGIMQNGMKGAGSAPGDIMLFKAMGGFEGSFDFAKVHQMNKMKQGGFLENPDILKKVIAQIPKGDLNTRAGMFETFFKDWGIDGKASELMLQMNDSGFLGRVSKRKGDMLTNIKDMAKGGDSEASRWLKEIQSNPALARQSLEAQKDMNLIGFGEKISKATEGFEKGVADFGKTILDKGWIDALKGLDGTGKALLAGAGLIAAGGAMSMIGGISSMGGKGAGMLAGMAGNPLAWLAGGGLAAYGIFKDGGQGANYWGDDKLTAITGKSGIGAPRYSKAWVPDKGMFDAAAQRYGLDPALLYSVARTESGFRSNAISKKGAIGYMQLMPGTASGMGIDPTDRAQNIDGGARFLSSLLKRYDGDIDKALAAYNWGGGNVDKKGMSHLPSETEKYIRDVKTAQAGYAADGLPVTVAQDSTMRMIADILQVIAANTGGKIPTAQLLPVSK